MYDIKQPIATLGKHIAPTGKPIANVNSCLVESVLHTGI